MKYNDRFHCVVSADSSGMMEYWDPEEPFELPKTVAFEYKSDTDLYEFKKVTILPIRHTLKLCIILRISNYLMSELCY